jgi:3-phenylpropionate/trans-cinnamate dioxygenase ferredoxin subunit
MSFERVCAADDVRPDEAFAATVGDVDVAVARDGDTFHAVHDLCSHAQVALTEGEVEKLDGRCTIECWLHGSRFDLVTGRPSGPPATDPIATFPVEVRDDGIYVDTTTTLNGVTP